MDIRQLLFWCVLMVSFTATALRPAVTVDDIQYTIYEGKAFVFDDHLKSLDIEITIPETISYEGETYTVSGFFTEINLSPVECTKFPNGNFLPRTLNLPATCTEYVIEETNHKAITTTYNTYPLSTFLLEEGGGLRYLNIAPGGKYYTYDGALYSSGCLLTVPQARTGKLTISPDCTRIATTPYAADSSDQNLSISELVLSNYVTYIGREAFVKCYELTSVTTYTPDTAPQPSAEIDETYGNGICPNAFDGCYKLKSFEIPEGVATIHSNAINCPALQTVVIPKTLSSVKPYAFEGCNALKKFDVAADSPYLTYSDGALYTAGLDTLLVPIYTKTTYTTPHATRHIAEGAFYKNENIQSVTFSEGLETIGREAFYYCHNITDITLPSTVTSIGQYAFAAQNGKSPERTIALGDGIKEILNSAFLYNSISSINFGTSLELIDNSAFYSAIWPTGISIDFPSTLRKIGASAFYSNNFVLIPQLSFCDLEYLGDHSLEAFFPKKIYCGRWTPPVCEGDPFFKKAYTLSQLLVPTGAEKSYMTANVWWDFENVEGMEYSGVTDIAADSDTDVRVSGDRLLITVADGTPVQVFSTDGRCVHTSTSSTSVELPAGIYIVRTGNTSRKVRL